LTAPSDTEPQKRGGERKGRKGKEEVGERVDRGRKGQRILVPQKDALDLPLDS